MSQRDYGTATAEESRAGFELATEIARKIKAVPNPAVRNMVKKLIALINIDPPPRPSESPTVAREGKE